MSAGDDLRGPAAEYALGLLDGPDIVDAERRLALDAAFAAEVTFWRDRLAAFDMTVTPHPAGDGLWTLIARDLGLPVTVAGPRQGPARRETRPGFLARLWDGLVFWRWLSASGLAAVAALVALTISGSVQPEPVFVAVLTTDTGRPGAVIHAYADGRVTLIPLEMAPVPTGRTLQVWAIPRAPASPVAIGLMDRVRTIRLDLRRLMPVALQQQFAISLEPSGGSSTGLPSGPVIMRGEVASTR
jgi:anti-sigma-K factor RskA